MPGWRFDPVTFDGVTLTGAPFLKCGFTWEDPAMAKLRRRAVDLDVPGDYSFPELARGQMESATAILRVELSAWEKTDLNTVRRVFDRFKGDVDLVVNDSDSLGWKTTVRVEQLVEEQANVFNVHLYIRRPIWERTANTVDGPRVIGASGTAFDLNSGGVVRAYPEFLFDPSAQKAAADDYRNRWQVSIAWRSELPGEDHEGNGYPIDIADDSLDTNTEIGAGRLQADGDDLTVLVDGVQYPRTIDGLASATAKVWVPISFSPAKSVLLAAASGAGSPATGGNWDVQSGESLDADDWPSQGSFMVDTERVWYGRRTDTQFQLIRRGHANTTAAAHSAGATGWWVEHDIQILSNWSAAPAQTPASFAMSTSLSTNLAHTYNQFIRAASGRYSQPFLRYTADNRIAPYMSFEGATTQARFLDKPPGGVYTPFNNMELYVPCGVKAAASALAYTLGGDDLGANWPGSDVFVTLRLFGVDFGGVEQLLATFGAVDRSGALTFTPASVLQRIRFNALFNLITGVAYTPNPTPAATDSIGTIDDELAQRFTLDQETTIRQFAVFAKESAGADTAILDLFLGAPSGARSAEFANDLDPRDNYWFATIPNASFTTTLTWVATVLTIPVVIAAGSYSLVMREQAGAGAIQIARFNEIYARGEAWDETAAGVWAAQYLYDYGIAIIGDGSIVQDDAPSGFEGYASVDDLVITFDNTTPRTPLIVRGAQESIYPLRARITHTDLGFYFDLFHVMALTDTLTVRTKTKEVILNESLAMYAPQAIAPSDPEEWFYLRGTGTATDNTITYTETGVTGLGLTTTWADAWA